jgi:hypothetical protein
MELGLSRENSSSYKWEDIPDPEDEDAEFAPQLNYMRVVSNSVEEQKLTRNNSFKVFEETDIDAKQERLVERVTSLFKVSDNLAKALLIKFQWDFDVLQHEYLNNPNLVYQLFNYDPETTMDFQPSGEFLCPCCYMETMQTIGMEC